MAMMGEFSTANPVGARARIERCLSSSGRASVRFLHDSGGLVVGTAPPLGEVEPVEAHGSSSGRTVAIVAGRLTGRLQTAGLLADAFERGAMRSLGEASGRFVSALLGQEAPALWLVRGICGQRGLFYGRIPDGIAFASDLRALLRHPEIPFRMNGAALAEYLRCGVVWGSHTLAEGVHVLLPAHAIRFDLGRRVETVSPYAGLPRGDEVPDATEAVAEIESEIAKSLAAAVEEGPGVALCLSAGRDSRTLMAIAQRAGIRLDCITNGVRGGIELELTRRMCETLGQRHVECLIGSELVEAAPGSLREVAACTGGEGSPSSAMMLHVGRRYREQFGLRRVIRGHGGELMKLCDAYGFALPPPISLGQDHEAAKRVIFSQLSTSALEAGADRALGAEAGELFRSSVRDAFDSNYDAWAGTSSCAGQAASLLFLTQYNGRHTVNAMRCMRQSVDVVQPFLEEDVARSILRSPPALRSGHAMQVSLIRRNEPRLLRIPESELRIPLDASRCRRRWAAARMRIANRLRPRPQDVPERWLALRLRDLVHEILREERSLARNHVSAMGLRDLLERDRRGEIDGREALARLALVECFLRDLDETVGIGRGARGYGHGLRGATS